MAKEQDYFDMLEEGAGKFREVKEILGEKFRLPRVIFTEKGDHFDDLTEEQIKKLGELGFCRYDGRDWGYRGCFMSPKQKENPSNPNL